MPGGARLVRLSCRCMEAYEVFSAAGEHNALKVVLRAA